MTNEQKSKVTDLRKQGYGYASIGSTLGLSKDSVKSFCRRSGLTGLGNANDTKPAVSANACLNCGAPLIQITGRKKKKFCRPECRQAWWNTHPDQVRRKANYTCTCAGCRKSYTAYGNNHRKYCSHSCYIIARFKGGNGA